jgi:hypothetical protein
MRTQNLQKRVADLEFRQMSTNKPHSIFEKYTDAELRQLKEIVIRTKSGMELTPEEIDFLKGLEAEYGPR